MPAATPKPKGLYTKLAEVLGEVGYVQKRGVNSFHKYKYVTEADLVDAVREKLSSRGVVLIPSLMDVGERQTTKSIVTTARVKFTFVDAETGEKHEAEWAGQGEDPADKGLYSAYTGAMKYFLMKTFLIPTGDDPEANTRTDERVAQGGSAPVAATTYGKPQKVPPEKVAAVAKAFTEAGVSPDEFDLILKDVGLDDVANMTVAHAQQLRVVLDQRQAEAAERIAA